MPSAKTMLAMPEGLVCLPMVNNLLYINPLRDRPENAGVTCALA